MSPIRYFGWLIPVAIFGLLAILTPISPWLLGAGALLVIVLGYAVGWLFYRARKRKAGSNL